MKFRFPYEKLQEHRKREEDMAQRDFLAARQMYDQAVHELEEMYLAIDQARQRAGDLHTKGGSCAEDLKQIDQFITGQVVRIQRQKDRIRELASVMEEKQAILVIAAQEFKKVEKLRERMFERFKEALKKKEAKELDDMVTMRFVRGEK